MNLPENSRLLQNLSAPALIEQAVRRGEAVLTADGALAAQTGRFTGRSPQDKFIVEDEVTRGTVDWGAANQPISTAGFDSLAGRVGAYLQGRDLFVLDCFAGADPQNRLPVRIVTTLAWHALFAHQLLIPATVQEQASFVPEFTIVDAARFEADPVIDHTRSSTFILLSFTRRLALIGGTEYAGEIKKSVFSLLNFLLPRRGILPMHCSANAGADGSTALFFGLSGTGKTTLSADPERFLIGDDEHGWSDAGIFNFEGGCYAKCIHLSPEKEAQIYNAIKFGAVLENVVLDDVTRQPDYDNESLTENTRAAYPLSFIPGAATSGMGDHPATVLFLTADAFGVLPPIARLTEAQAMYQFLSGYTSKLAGTELGVTAPQATFSACYGAPFMPLPPALYAEMLGERLVKHGSVCYLVNTGWTGGGVGAGRRMDLAVTRALVKAALDGSLADRSYTTDPVFGLQVPDNCPGVPPDLLQPRATWPDPAEYDAAAAHLAALFHKNFERFPDVPAAIRLAGPRRAP